MCPLTATSQSSALPSVASEVSFRERRVSIAGDTIVVGAVGVSDRGQFTGSAYIFQHQQQSDAWREVKTLVASSRIANDHFGESVSIEGDTAIVGAPQADSPGGRGAAHVFERHREGLNAWGEVARLRSRDGSPDDAFGFSVAVSGDTVLIGSPGDSDAGLVHGGIGAGSVYLFTRQAHGWQEAVKRMSSEAALQDAFGWSVAIQGETAVVGAPGADRYGTDAGAAYVFGRNGRGHWNEVGQLWPASAAAGGCCRGFGWSVSVDGSSAAIGSAENDQGADGALHAGAIYVFHRGTGPRAEWRDAPPLTGAGNPGAAAAYLFHWTR